MVEAAPLWGIVQIVLLVVLCLSGIHIFVVLGVLGCGFAILYYGLNESAMSLIGITAWSRSADYTLSMIPLFILMGALVAECGIGRDAYDCIAKWLAKLKGGLAIVTTFSCALFGAVTGSSAATIVTIGGIGVPEMKRYGYGKSLRTGSIASASLLSNLIPPSMAAIFYSIFTDVSIGKLFIAILIPGIILMIFFSITIYVWVTINPSSAPLIGATGATFSLKEKFASLRNPIPIVIIFLVLIGGIYFGWFSPTEAGGMGASAVLVVVIIMGRLNWQRFTNSVTSTLKMTAMIFFTVMGAFVFTHTIALTRISNAVGDLVVSLGLGPIAAVWVIILVFLIAGCVLNLFAMMVLFIPLFFNVVTGLGWDPVWFGVLCVVLVEIALITPPMAANIYITQLLDPDASVGEIIKGVVPFYFSGFALLALLVYFPQIALWLVGTM